MSHELRDKGSDKCACHGSLAGLNAARLQTCAVSRAVEPERTCSENGPTVEEKIGNRLTCHATM